MKVFLDMHVLQSVPPSCLNRDDTGSPKTAFYGGVRRARVSSQAWKRAIRLHFNEQFDKSELSMRTKHIFDLVAEEIMKIEPDLPREEAMAKATAALSKVGVKPSGKKGEDAKLDALFFVSTQQVKNVAAVALGEAEAKEVKKALQDNNGVDLALFGRMVAADPELNCDASAQVAHAISTHRVENEYDFFTAVDDMAAEKQEHAGASHVGTVEYNSATLYRYATVAAHELFKELANDPVALEKAITAFTNAFISSIPTGRQNTFAAHTVPDAVLVTIRTDRPLNLAGAFEKPVPVTEEGFVVESAKRLTKYALSIYADFCTEPEVSYVVGQHLDGLDKRLTLNELLGRIGKEVAERCI